MTSRHEMGHIYWGALQRARERDPNSWITMLPTGAAYAEDLDGQCAAVREHCKELGLQLPAGCRALSVISDVKRMVQDPSIARRDSAEGAATRLSLQELAQMSLVSQRFTTPRRTPEYRLKAKAAFTKGKPVLHHEGPSIGRDALSELWFAALTMNAGMSVVLQAPPGADMVAEVDGQQVPIEIKRVRAVSGARDDLRSARKQLTPGGNCTVLVADFTEIVESRAGRIVAFDSVQASMILAQAVKALADDYRDNAAVKDYECSDLPTGFLFTAISCALILHQQPILCRLSYVYAWLPSEVNAQTAPFMSLGNRLQTTQW